MLTSHLISRVRERDAKKNLNLIVSPTRLLHWSFFLASHHAETRRNEQFHRLPHRQINKLSNTWLMTLELALLNYVHNRQLVIAALRICERRKNIVKAAAVDLISSQIAIFE